MHCESKSWEGLGSLTKLMMSCRHAGIEVQLQIMYYFGSGLNVPLLIFEFPNALFVVYCITGYYQTKGGATSSRERGVSEREGEEEEEQVIYVVWNTVILPLMCHYDMKT